MATEMSLAARLRQAQDYPEGAITQAIEDEAAKLPNDFFLWGALSVFGLSLALFNAGKKADAMFIGQLATPILALGIYKRLVQHEADAEAAAR